MSSPGILEPVSTKFGSTYLLPLVSRLHFMEPFRFFWQRSHFSASATPTPTLLLSGIVKSFMSGSFVYVYGEFIALIYH